MSSANFILPLIALVRLVPNTQALPNPVHGPLRQEALQKMPIKNVYPNHNERNRLRRHLLLSETTTGDTKDVVGLYPEGMRLGDKSPFPPPDPSRIYEGDFSGMMNFMVSLQYMFMQEWYHFCGATVITNYSLLTAAHCFPEESHRLLFRAVFRDNVISYEEADFAITFRFENVHLDTFINFTGNSRGLFDNAIILLPDGIPLGGNISTICLVDRVDFHVDYYFVFGWGWWDCQFPSNTMRYAQGWDDTEMVCEAAWKDIGNRTLIIDEGQMCAHFRGSEGAAVSTDKGDSGGPLTANIFDGAGNPVGVGQFGIVSFGYKFNATPSCPDVRIPQVFSKISSHMEFIKEWAPNVTICPHPDD